MNAPVAQRPFVARAVAAVIAMILVMSGSIAFAATASADEIPTPVVTVSPSSNVDTTVANTFTITGSGFVGAGAINGAYVNLGAASLWAPGSVPGSSGWVASGFVPTPQVIDGAFTTTLVVPANILDPAVAYGVSTFAAHALSITDRTLDTFTPISFAASSIPAAPVITVTPNADIDSTVANTFTVSGTGFTGPGAANGTYVNVGAASVWAPGTVPGQGGFLKSAYVPAQSIVNGAFSTTVTVDATAFDPAVAYGISTFAAHALSATDRSLDTFTPITVKKLANPVVTVTPNTNIDPAVANTFTVSGTGFTGVGAANGTYVSVGSESAWTPGTVPDATKFVATVWVMPSKVVGGAFTVTVPVAAGKLDPSERYVVSTMAAHGLSITDRSLDTFTPIAIKSSLIPAGPVVTVTPSTDIDTTVANTFTVSGAGFTGPGAASGAYVNLGKQSVWAPGSVPGTAGFDTSVWVMPQSIVNGSFTTTITVAANTLDSTLKYGIATFAAHGLSITNRSLDSYTPIALRAVPLIPTAVALSSAPATGAEVGTPVTLTASVSPAVAGTITFFSGSTRIDSVAVTPTSASATVSVSGLAVGTASLRADFTPAAALVYSASNAAIDFIVSAKPVVGAGSLAWGVKESFRSYVTGPIAKGAISTSGVSSSGGIFTFGQSSGGTFDRATGVGSSNYTGSVRFTGHAGVLDVTLSNPVVRIDSATAATLLVSVNGGAASPFATLNLAAGSLGTPNNTVSYSGVPAALTSQGAAAFSLNGSGFYPVGAALDPVSFVIGAPSTVSSTVGTTVASFAAPRTAAPTPPATTGITIAEGSALVEGGEVTITATGFRANETGILVVIYSEPTVLATNATADATGTVTWTGKLPAGLSGTHTLTLQGSVNRGIELTIAAASVTEVAGCVVDDATLTWGFKESFRAYVNGSIANGEWTVANGATYAVPNFGWAAGTGGYDPANGAGSLAFAGSITFTGHGGVLNTTVANPQIRFADADTAYLLLDVSGTTQDGAAVDSKAVEFAEIDLAGALDNDGGAVTITAAPATLTAGGAAAFGTYPEGEALDPITSTFTVAADCAEPVDEIATPTSTTSVEAVADDEPVDFGWVVWVALALLVIAVVAVIVVRRRRA